MTPRRRDIIQNLVIVCLLLSSVYLFARTQIDTIVANGAYLDQLINTTSTPNTASIRLTDLSSPVQVAVTDVYGRHGDLCLTTGGERFVDLGILLKTALDSASEAISCGESEFWDALSDVSIYYRFPNALPLSILAGLIGGNTDRMETDVNAQCLILSGEKSTVQLWLWDGKQTYLRCDTGLSTSEIMLSPTGNQELENVFFGFDMLEDGPCSLLPEVLPDFPAYSVASSLSSISMNDILTDLGFMPGTRNRYTESSGTEVIIENDRDLRIRPDGMVSFQSGWEPLLKIQAAGEIPTAVEAVTGTGELLLRLLDGRMGEAVPYLRSVEQTDDTTILEFDCQISGVPICFSDGKSICKITLTGTGITALTLRFRQYTAAGRNSLLLPARQALAISAAQMRGSFMSIAYVDNGGDTVDACWLSDS